MSTDVHRRFVTAIRAVLDDHDVSVRAITQRAGLKERSIQTILDGHSPSINKAHDVCRALGIRLELGSHNSAKPPPVSQTSSAPPAALEPVADRELAELLAMLAADWEGADERRRGAIVHVLRTQLGLVNS